MAYAPNSSSSGTTSRPGKPDYAMPMLCFPDACPHCYALHPGGGWAKLGDHDCPQCGAKDVFHVEWETEFGFDPADVED